MSFLRHITACNTHDLSHYRPFFVAGQRVGMVREDLCRRLAGFGDPFTIRYDGIAVSESLAGPAERTAAVRSALDRLVEEGEVPPLRGEDYPVLSQWGTEPLMAMDRAAMPCFGLKCFGLHVNGYVRKEDGLHLWVGKRAMDRGVAPGQYDNLVAGGQPAGLSLAENLEKEGAEEASLPPELVRRAVPVGIVSYLMGTEAGLKDDSLFCYDLELDEAFEPRNTDGEVERFELWPVSKVAESVERTDDWKFNVNLVVIDFLIRHGFLTPDHPEYMALCKGLRR